MPAPVRRDRLGVRLAARRTAGSRAGAPAPQLSTATARGAVMRSNSPVDDQRRRVSSSVASVAISTIGSFFG